MSLPADGEQALAFIATLRSEQEKVILGGQFTMIEEYRAACATVRNLGRIAAAIEKIYSGRTAAEAMADKQLTDFINPKDKVTS